MQRTKIDNSPIKRPFAAKNSSIPTLIAVMKPVVFDNYGFECRETIKLKGLFLEFPDYQDSDANEKIHDFLPEYPFKRVMYSIEILVQEIELVAVDK